MTKNRYSIKDNIQLYTGLAWDTIKDLIPRKPSIPQIAIGAGSVLAPIIPAVAGNITIENTIHPDDEKVSYEDLLKTRLKFGVGPVSTTYDFKPNGIDEGKLWVDVVNGKEWSLGFLAQGETEEVGEAHRYADVGGCVTKHNAVKGNDLEVFVGPTIQKGVLPANFYQVALRDTTGNRNIIVAVVDDQGKVFGWKTLDARAYVTGQKGNTFGGLGVNTKGLEDIFSQGPVKIYGGLGSNNKDLDLGGMSIFRYNPRNGEYQIKSQGALGDREGSFDLSKINCWQDIQGPGMRGVGKPYFSAFPFKGDLTAELEAICDPKNQDVKAMIAQNLGLVRLGGGISYNKNEGEKGKYGAMVIAGQKFNISDKTNGSVEIKYNSGTKNFDSFVKLSQDF